MSCHYKLTRGTPRKELTLKGSNTEMRQKAASKCRTWGARHAIDECMRLAWASGADEGKTGDVARSTATGAAIGGAVTGVYGAVRRYSDVGNRAAAGAAAGAASGLIRGGIRASEPSKTFKGYVNRLQPCTEDGIHQSRAWSVGCRLTRCADCLHRSARGRARPTRRWVHSSPASASRGSPISTTAGARSGGNGAQGPRASSGGPTQTGSRHSPEYPDRQEKAACGDCSHQRPGQDAHHDARLPRIDVDPAGKAVAVVLLVLIDHDEDPIAGRQRKLSLIGHSVSAHAIGEITRAAECHPT